MPTNAELKALTQSEIRDKTAPESVTRANIADVIDAAYDYTDQQIATVSSVIKVAKISLSSSDISNLNTTPIVLVPAITGKVILPRSVFQKYTHVTTAYTSGANWRLAFGTPSLWISSFAPAVQSASNSEGINEILGSNATVSGNTFAEKDLLLTNVFPWVGGDGTMILYIEYIEITL